MTEFFYANQMGKTQHNNALLKHHFTFAEYYQPTKFGRSTLRRADYVTLDNTYHFIAQRDCLLLLYPFDDIDFMLNDKTFDLKKDELSGFLVPIDTHIHFITKVKKNFFLSICDIKLSLETFIPFDFTDINFSTQINIMRITDINCINLQNKPFWGLILKGDVWINDTKLGFCDGFYTNSLLEIKGNAQILTVSMPVPL